MRAFPILLSLLCFPLVAAGAPVDPRVADQFGAEAVQVLQHADEMEVFSVTSSLLNPDEDPPSDTDLIDGFPITGRGQSKSGPEAIAIGNRLLSSVLYKLPKGNTGSFKLCAFQPGIVLRFWSAGDHSKQRPVDVFICLHCNVMSVVRPAQGNGLSHGPQTQWDVPGSYLNSDPGHGALLNLAATLLPNDPALKELMTREGLKNGTRRSDP